MIKIRFSPTDDAEKISENLRNLREKNINP